VVICSGDFDFVGGLLPVAGDLETALLLVTTPASESLNDLVVRSTPARHHLPGHATWAGSVCTLLPLPIHSRRLPLNDPDELDTATLRTVTAPLASGTKADSLEIETVLLDTPVPPTLLDSNRHVPRLHSACLNFAHGIETSLSCREGQCEEQNN